MTPQVLVGYLKSIFNDSSSIGQIPRKLYSITPQVLVRYLERYINDSSSIGEKPKKYIQ